MIIAVARINSGLLKCGNNIRIQVARRAARENWTRKARRQTIWIFRCARTLDTLDRAPLCHDEYVQIRSRGTPGKWTVCETLHCP